MTDYDFSETILIIRAANTEAATALQSEHNKRRLKLFPVDPKNKPEGVIGPGDSAEESPGMYRNRPRASIQDLVELHLQFSPEPRDKLKGFTFGRDGYDCDIHLQKDPSLWTVYGVSNTHFYITLNWQSGQVELHNKSRNGTCIYASYIKDGSQVLRDDYMVTLPPDEVTRISAGLVEFDLVIPVRTPEHQEMYEKKSEKFRSECRRLSLPLPGVFTYSSSSTGFPTNTSSDLADRPTEMPLQDPAYSTGYNSANSRNRLPHQSAITEEEEEEGDVSDAPNRLPY